MSGSWIVSQERKPPVRLLLAFVWLLLGGAVLACIISKAGDPPDGSPVYYLFIRPLASLAPLFGAIWLFALVAPHWSRIRAPQRASLLFTLIASATFCAWVFYTVWRMRA